MDWNLDYGDLIHDRDFVEKCENLKDELIAVQKVLDQLLPLKDQYEQLSIPAQIELDLALAFMLNSLYWVNLRLQGIDVTTHPIKRELERIKDAMIRWQLVKESKMRPTVNVEAAKRFVRSGLYDPKQNAIGCPPNKKTKFGE